MGVWSQPPKRLGSLLVLALGVIVTVGSVSAESSFVTPGPNKNLIGVTPNPSILNVPDFSLKQQNEPSCIIRPTNSAYIFCAFNDMRASDQATIQGDGWIGVATSGDRGKTWFSTLTPGYLGHPNSIGMGFAADPGVISLPGNAPGLAVLSYIGGFRDSDDGVLAIQRWVEFNQEDGNFWKPEDQVRIVADGSEGRFVDKPGIAFVQSTSDPQPTITELVTVSGESQPIEVTTVAGTIVIAYSVFTGEAGTSKIYVEQSIDNGKSWTRTKLSEEQNVVTGVSITALGDDFVVVYRRQSDSNNTDAVMSVACTTTGNKKCSKGQVAFEICPFDQQATGSTFRTFTFPSVASDGERYWAFSAHRIAADGSCTEVDPGLGVPAGTYAGTPRIVGMSSTDGKNWVGADGNPDKPFTLDENAGIGSQVIPFAVGTKGRIDVSWWDTRREEPLPSGNVLLDGVTPVPLINDYLSGTARIFRKADVFMTRLTANCNGGPQAGCTPVIENPVRVSQYPVDLINGVVQETKANRLNLRTHGSGSVAFLGDYHDLSTRSHRQTDTGRWIPNSLPRQSDEDVATFIIEEDLFAAWGDARDVVGQFIADPNGAQQSQYSPPANAATPGFQAKRKETNAEESAETLVAGIPSADQHLKAASEPDDDPGLPSDISSIACSSSNDLSRSRDTNVYGSLVQDKPTLVALTQTRPLNTVQRMFPLVFSHPGPTAAPYCLTLTQPEDFPGGGHASFYPLPAVPTPNPVDQLDVVVPAFSSVSRSAFVVTSDSSSIIHVRAYEGSCPVAPNTTFGALVGTVQLSDGQLFDSDYCEQVGCPDVDVAETHDLSLVSPGLQAPVLQAPILQASGLLAPGLQAPGFQAPGFQADQLEAPILQAESLLSPGLQAPSFQAPSLQAALLDETPDIGYQDVTYVLAVEGNVTTTNSVDIAVTGLETSETEVELIAWVPNVHTTSVASSENCLAAPESDNQIIAAVNLGSPGFQAQSLGDVTLPTAFTDDNQQPYAGEVSFAGTPNKQVAVTVRLWVTGGARQTLEALYQETVACEAAGDPDVCDPSKSGVNQLIALGASAHGCSTNALPTDSTDPSNPDCLNNGNEKIEPPDNFPPVFTPEDGTTISLEVSSGAGALLATPGGIPDFIEVSDLSEPIDISCESTSPNFVLVDGQSTVPLSGIVQDPSTGENVLAPTGIACTATDAAENVANASFFINVIDPFPPVLSINTNSVTLVANASQDGTGGAFADYSAQGLSFEATDDFNYPTPTEVTPDCTPASGAFFEIGTTTVSCTISDAGPNALAQANVSNSVEFDVTVVDGTAPTITVPEDLEVDGTDASGAIVDYEVTVTDETDPNPSFSCEPASGSLFPSGPTIVQCTATDAAGNTADASFLVTVNPAFNATGITTTKKNPKPGTSIPLYWAWLDANGVPVDVGDGNQDIRFMTGSCPGGDVIAGDPGSSSFQQNADFSWQYNWQAVDANGNDLPASNQGGGTPYCIKVTLLTTNQEQFGEIKLKP